MLSAPEAIGDSFGGFISDPIQPLMWMGVYLFLNVMIVLGLAVFGGAIASAVLGAIFGPVFFKIIQGLREKIHRGRTPPVV